MAIDDSAFEQFAKKQEEEAAAAQNRGKGGASSGDTFTKIEWSGLESNRMKLIRAVGGPPDSKLDNFTAKTTRVSWIIGDDGKKFRCILPERGDAPDHLLWRIISRVKAVEWVDKVRVNTVEVKHPAIFNIIAHNGLTSADKAFIFDRGWEGQQKLIMNVIDRERMDWHRENKHTLLLSKSIGVGKDGTLFPEEGVPSWGFSSLLANLFKFYKSWEKYDIGIVRTGLKEAPYRIINAGKYIEEVPSDLQAMVVQAPLTEEESNWERYDLNKLFANTKYVKIFNKLQVTVARIDAALGTHFLQELKDAVEIEKAQDAANAPTAEPEHAFVPTPDAPPAAAPVRTRPAPEASKPGVSTELLLGWNALTAAEKSAIVGTTVKDGKLVEVQYADANATLLACPKCQMPGPDSFMTCPGCGQSFA